MRLPARYRTRKGYQTAAVAAAFLPATVLALLIGSERPITLFLPLITLGLFSVAIFSGWLWPKRKRTTLTMIGRGAAVIALSLFSCGLIAASLIILNGLGPTNPWEMIKSYFTLSVLALIFGSVFTLGVPWILGIGVTLLFRDDPA